MGKLQDMFVAVRDELNSEFYERGDAIDAMLIALLSREHVHLDGDPGSGKSMLVRSLAQRITGSTYFEQVLSRTRPDAAILGPYNIQLLRDKSQFRRKDEGYLTTADVAFLDEAFKMSPTLGHDLLAALNERLKHDVGDDGRSSSPIPLWTAITASNEIPKESDAAALWDRILLRVRVEYVSDAQSFYSLLDHAGTPGENITATIPLDGVKAAHDETKEVILPLAVLDQVASIKAHLSSEGIVVSDRRWRASIKAVRSAAWLAGHKEVEAEDLEILYHTLWSAPDEVVKVRRAVNAVARPDTEEVDKLADGLAEILTEWGKSKGLKDTEKITAWMELKAKTDKISKDAKALRTKTSSPRTKADVDTFLKRVSDSQRQALEDVGLSDMFSTGDAGEV